MSKSDFTLLATIGGAAAIVWAFLYAWLPYASGYGSERVSVLYFANWIWKGGEDWEHCYLVPFAVVGIIYWQRKQLAALPIRSSWAGLVITLLGFFVYWVGFRADNVYIGYASFQILAAGIIIWMLGWRWMLGLLFPWAFLCFVYPLPFLDNMVAFPLRLVMSEASVDVLNIIGLPAIKSGTAILSASDAASGLKVGQRFSVDVANPCSGIRSLFALMMVSALYSYLTQPGIWRKIVLFLCSMPLAVLGNLFRIIMLTFGTLMMGPDVAIGTLEHPAAFHMISGYVVFVVALSGLLGIGWLLNLDYSDLLDRTRAYLEKKEHVPRASATVSPEKQSRPFQDEY